MIARETKKLQAAELLALVGDGYTLRRGSRQTGRVRFAAEWQVFSPGGELVGPANPKSIEWLAYNGHLDKLHTGFNSPLRGAHR